MSYQLSEINFRTVADPVEFMAECDEQYRKKIEAAAEKILKHKNQSPIILLAGPSGSGKTTTSMKIAEELERRGVKTHYVAMDDYFRTVDESYPRTAEGTPDLESPLCLDLALLSEHFTKLARGERIFVPKYEFSRQMRVVEPSKSIRLGKDEMIAFEGIHAHNGMITRYHPDAFRLHISADSDVMFGEREVFDRTWFRLVRRMVRDHNFRGTSAEETMKLWDNVLRGERLYITPFKRRSDLIVDTSFAYELAVYNETATELFQEVPEGIERFDELRSVLPAIQLFGDIDPALVAEDAMIREFIGGGIYA